MINSEDEYWRVGKDSALAMMQGDKCRYDFNKQWFRQAKEIEGDAGCYAEAAWRDGWNSVQRPGQTNFSKIPY